MKKLAIDSRFKTFNPRDYLEEYYTHIGAENYALLKFSTKVSKIMKKGSFILEFGGGPTIYPLISLAPKSGEIHFSDYLDKNLKEIIMWKKNRPNSFDWRPFIRSALQIEGIKNTTIKDVNAREQLLRKKISKLLKVDAFNKFPLGKNYTNFYDVVNVNFVLDSITDSKLQWEQIFTNITPLLKKGGIIAMTTLKDASYWRTTVNKFYPAVRLDENDVKNAFVRNRFQVVYLSSIPAEIVDEKSTKYEGYKGFIFVIAKKT